jgi:hypothetical protein
MSKRTKSREKRIKPQIWVFCEGETEEAYVAHLRSRYRVPIEIVTRVAGTGISAQLIRKHKKGKPSHPKDKNYLMYDADVQHLLDKIITIAGVTLLLSNPVIELWFLLHFKNQKASLSTDDCVRELNNRLRNTYKKGKISNRLSRKLEEECNKACARARSLTSKNNPSTNLYVFIEALESIKRQA